MKLLPILLINLVVTGGAILIYDQTRPAPPAKPVVELETKDITALVDAVAAALEVDEPAELRGDGGQESLLRRLLAIEARIAKLGTAPAVVPDTADPAEEVATPVAPMVEGEPSDEELEKFRRLQKAARERDWMAKRAARVDKVLAKAGLTLSGKQRDQLIRAERAFNDRFNEIWGEAKQSGAAQGDAADWSTIIRETNQTIQAEFTERINTFLPQADAEAVSAAMYPSEK